MIFEVAGGKEDVIDSVVAEIEQLPENALVLDIGGGVKPLRRANYVVDLTSYEERGSYGNRGAVSEHYSRNSWVVADLCSPEDWLLGEKSFDYIFCSQTIEDLRDPIRLLRYIQRIGKRGFISTVHWTFEANEIRDSRKALPGLRWLVGRWSGCNYVGYPHHRWLVSLRDGDLEFVWKSAVLHANRSIRPPIKQMLYHLKWEGSFEVHEVNFPADQNSQTAFVKSLQELWK